MEPSHWDCPIYKGWETEDPGRLAVKYPGCSKVGLCTPLALRGEEQSSGGQVAGFSQIIVSNWYIHITPRMTQQAACPPLPFPWGCSAYWMSVAIFSSAIGPLGNLRPIMLQVVSLTVKQNITICLFDKALKKCDIPKINISYIYLWSIYPILGKMSTQHQLGYPQVQNIVYSVFSDFLKCKIAILLPFV